MKTKLHNTSKGSTPISEYLLRIKALANALVSIGCVISDFVHIAVILGGLSSAFVTSMNTRVDPYSVANIKALLLAHESRIEQA